MPANKEPVNHQWWLTIGQSIMSFNTVYFANGAEFAYCGILDAPNFIPTGEHAAEFLNGFISRS